MEKLKKALKIICWILFVLAIAGLFLSTYLNSSGVNERWNENVSPWLGGASIAVVATTIIQLVVNFASKANLDLGISRFGKDSKAITENVNNLAKEFRVQIEENKKLKEELIETRKQMQIAIKQSQAILNNQVEIANHDEKMVRNGTAKRLVKNVEEIEYVSQRENVK